MSDHPDAGHGAPGVDAMNPVPQRERGDARTVRVLARRVIEIARIDAREAGPDARAGNLPVRRYVPPAAFGALETIARKMGFARVACSPLVRSSYHADRQARAADAAQLSIGNP
jgi:hypothetical protein